MVKIISKDKAGTTHETLASLSTWNVILSRLEWAGHKILSFTVVS